MASPMRPSTLSSLATGLHLLAIARFDTGAWRVAIPKLEPGLGAQFRSASRQWNVSPSRPQPCWRIRQACQCVGHVSRSGESGVRASRCHRPVLPTIQSRAGSVTRTTPSRSAPAPTPPASATIGYSFLQSRNAETGVLSPCDVYSARLPERPHFRSGARSRAGRHRWLALLIASHQGGHHRLGFSAVRHRSTRRCRWTGPDWPAAPRLECETPATTETPGGV